MNTLTARTRPSARSQMALTLADRMPADVDLVEADPRTGRAAVRARTRAAIGPALAAAAGLEADYGWAVAVL
jgi:hypothetical protein